MKYDDPLSTVKDRPISNIISNYIQLKKINQSQLKGLCPFHKEKTPSFTVDDAKNFYKCFGCGAGGDAISFLEKFLNLNFQDSLEKACNILGITFEKSQISKSEIERRHNYYSLNEKINNYYIDCLKKNEEASSYLKKRGISNEIIMKFKIGFAPSRNEFLNFIMKTGIDVKKLTELNLIKDYNGKVFPLFESRIMIPIINKNNKIIAFGGRIISNEKDVPKYINSTNSPIFKKNENMYNVNNIYNRKIEQLFILEGYMDVITMSSFGFDSIASLGTAINEDQIENILKISKSPIFCLDNDEAGKNATIHLVEKALQIIKPGDKIKILRVEDSKDVDEYLRKYGTEKFNKLLAEKTQDLYDFVFEFYLNKTNLEDPNEIAEFKDLLLNKLCSNIKNEIIKESYKDFFKDKFYKLNNKLKYGERVFNLNKQKQNKISKDNIILKYIEKLTKICSDSPPENLPDEENLITLSQKLKKRFPNNSFSIFIDQKINNSIHSHKEEESYNKEREKLIRNIYEILDFYLNGANEPYAINRIRRKKLLDKKKSEG